MLTYKCYKFPNKDHVPKYWPENVSVSEIGEIKSKDDVYDNEGNKIVSGPVNTFWHVNISYQGNVDLTHLQQYEIKVKTPNRIWFGQQS